jgi:hypothetical protein
MANSFATIDKVASEIQRIAHEKAQFIGTVDHQYDSEYAKTGGKIGSVLRVQKPNKYTRRTNSRIMSIQDIVDETQPFTLAAQDGVDIAVTSADMALSFDRLSQKVIEPAVAILMSGIEADFLAFATKATYNTAGTAGTPPTDLAAVGQARAKLNQNLAPKDGNRFIQCDSVTMGGLVNGLKGLFQDSNQIKEQYREGMIGRTAMADWYENDRMWSMTNGNDVTGTTDAAALVTDGGNTVDMHTTVAVAAQVVGQVFTIAGVYGCHPETKAAYPSLQQFTITAIGASTTTVSPSIFLTGARQNVCSSTGATLLTTDFNSKALTFVGAANTSYVQNLMYHKEAFQFVSADLPIMDDAIKCVRKTAEDGGFSFRVWQASDIINDRMLLRVDALYGFAALRSEWACRITS